MFAGLFLLLTTLGCDVEAPGADDPSRGPALPPLSLLRVEARSYSTTVNEPLITVLDEQEPTQGVASSVSFTLYFDRFLLPHKVIRQSICLRPKLQAVESIEDCAEPYQAFTEPEYNPVQRSVTYRLPANQRLATETTYRLTLFVPNSLEESGFFGFDGAPLSRRYEFDFATSTDSGGIDAPLPSSERYCQAVSCYGECSMTHKACNGPCGDNADPEACQAICDSARQSCRADCEGLCIEASCFAGGELVDANRSIFGSNGVFSSCAFAGCHAMLPSSPDPSQLAMNLDLSSGEAIDATAIGRTAHLSQHGEAATQGDQSPARFGRAMPLIDPNNPGNSFLLYKLLTNPLNHIGNGAAPSPTTAKEINRLRDTAIPGLPMPTESGVSGPLAISAIEEPLDVLGVINAWIAHGAITSCQ